MSLAENLLNTLSEGSAPSSRIGIGDQEPHIVIGENRTITIPNEIKTIAVVGDKDVETVTFDCVRYWDEHDLSTFAIYLNYILPNSAEIKTYIPTNIVRYENHYSFEWTIGSSMTKNGGNIEISLVAKQTDEEGVLIRQWGSFSNRDLNIVKSLPSGSIDVEEDEETDIATQLLSALNSKISYDNIVQETGINPSGLMSQKAITNEIEKLNKKTLDEENRAKSEERRIEQLVGKPTQDAVNSWLDQHPEATTTVQDNSLTINKLVLGTLGYVMPEMFGAVGDGITDDTAALKQALGQVGKVYLSGTYLIREPIIVNSTNIIGQNATILVDADMSIVLDSNRINELSGFKLDCQGHNINYGINIVGTDIRISNVEVCNIRNTTNTKRGVRGINISGDIYDIDVSIDGYRAYNLQCLANGEIGDSNGAVNGIIIGSYQNLFATNLHFEEIHNINSSGEIVYEDSGGIYISSINEKASCVISGIVGKNFGKRLLKSQCWNISVDNIFSYNEYNDVGSHIAILPAGGIEQNGSNAIINNGVFVDTSTDFTLVIGENQSLKSFISVTGNAKIRGCDFSSEKLFGIIMNDQLDISDISIDECKFGNLGIFNVGHNSMISNCRFISACAIYSAVPTGKTMIKDSFLSWTKADLPFDYMNYNTFKGYTIINNCTIDAGDFSSKGTSAIFDTAHITNVIITMENPNLTKAADVFIVKVGANVHMKNICINGTQIASPRYISNIGVLYADTIEERNTSVPLINNTGTLHLKDTNIRRIYSPSGQLVVDQPPYVDTLPAISSMPDGVSVLLKTDNKMYKKISGEWVEVV